MIKEIHMGCGCNRKTKDTVKKQTKTPPKPRVKSIPRKK